MPMEKDKKADETVEKNSSAVKGSSNRTVFILAMLFLVVLLMVCGCSSWVIYRSVDVKRDTYSEFKRIALEEEERMKEEQEWADERNQPDDSVVDDDADSVDGLVVSGWKTISDSTCYTSTIVPEDSVEYSSGTGRKDLAWHYYSFDYENVHYWEINHPYNLDGYNHAAQIFVECNVVDINRTTDQYINNREFFNDYQLAGADYYNLVKIQKWGRDVYQLNITADGLIFDSTFYVFVENGLAYRVIDAQRSSYEPSVEVADERDMILDNLKFVGDLN